MNVNSLYRGPSGIGGKLDFLRQQVVDHRFNFIGVQESRCDPAFSIVDSILRIAGGGVDGQLGVELWVNLAQPFAVDDAGRHHFEQRHFQVLHSDPRRLLVRVSHPIWSCLILVGHGPHTGRDHSERQEWWNATHSLLQRYRHHLPLFVMIDANARTGDQMVPHILQEFDGTNGNSAFFRDFLVHQDLHLPCTGPCHQGQHDTWISPDGQHAQRIMLPCQCPL